MSLFTYYIRKQFPSLEQAIAYAEKRGAALAAAGFSTHAQRYQLAARELKGS